jgi:dTDP-4-dehydrorhamnose reductase
MKLAVIGANGQLGTDLQEVLSAQYDVEGLTHSDIEIVAIDSVNKVLSLLKPQIVFKHCVL